MFRTIEEIASDTRALADDAAGQTVSVPKGDLLALINAARKLPVALKCVAHTASAGGTLQDEQLESRTGPNDAAYRGTMLTGVRAVARQAVKDITGLTYEPFATEVRYAPEPF